MTTGGRLGALPSILQEVARFCGMVAATLLGLLAVTFFIGRVVPIDPVLAIVGDRAPPQVYDRVYHELGLDLPCSSSFSPIARRPSRVISGTRS